MFVKAVDVPFFVHSSDKMKQAFGDRQFGGWDKSKIVRELGDRVALKMLFVKMFFLISLVIVVLITELSGLSLEMIEIRELLEHPEPFIKPAVKTFDVRITPGLTKRDENNLYTKV